MWTKKLTCALAALLIFGLSACGEAEIIVPETLRVVSTQPASGAIHILPTEPITVVFSAPIVAETTSGDFFAVNQADSSIGTQISYSDDKRTVTIHPSESGKFALNTMYEVTIKKGVASSDPDIKPLPADVKFRFRTADVE